MPKGNPVFDKFTDARVAANDAMIALLVGSRLSAKTINDLGLKNDELITKVFDEKTLKGVSRFNLTSSSALRILRDAENHLAYMAIPYAVAVYERYVRDVIQALKVDSYVPVSSMSDDAIRDLKLENMLSVIFEKYDLQFDPIDQTLFSIVRQMRNRIIHSGGYVGSNLMPEYRNMQKKYKAEWEKLAGRPLTDAVLDRKFVLSEGELFVALAICQRLVNQIDEIIKI